MNDFSYKRYKEILTELKATKKLTTFHDVDIYGKLSYIVIRHDIEFSPMRAAKMAKIESDMGIETTYLVQVDSNAYNPFSQENLEYLRQIAYYDHVIGLHYNHDGKMKGVELADDIRDKIDILSTGLDRTIDIFSGHKPTDEFLKEQIEVLYSINCYDRRFFRHWSQPEKKNDAVYVADSNNEWRYGHPLKMLDKYDRIRMQIVIHPYTWNKKNIDAQNNFLNLLGEKIPEFNNEMRKYRNYK